MPFYAVAAGRKPGIYSTWEECKQQIDGFSGAKYKKFANQRDADAFVAGETPTVAPSKYPVIYVDGCSLGNGSDEANAGIGVWFGVDDPRNISESIGKGTNQMSEILAAIRGLEATTGAIEIRTDSMYVINSVTKWRRNWEQNGWKTSQRTDVLNQDLFRRLFALVDQRQIVWTHVRGHQGELGNEGADALAHAAASQN